MHILKNANPVPMGPGVALQPGEWLVEDTAAAQIMGQAGGGECELRAWHGPELRPGTRSLLIVRPGRFGDLICLTPVLRRLKHIDPDLHIAIATMPGYREPLLGLPYIDAFINYPVPLAEANNYQRVVCLEGLVSLAEDEMKVHITDLFAKRLDIDPETMPNKLPDLFLSMEERNWAFDAYPRKKDRKRIAFHVKSSTRSRDYPVANMNALMVALHSKGHEICFIGTASQFKWATEKKPPGIYFCIEDKLTFRQSCAVMATCDAFFGPDSAMIHAAAALDIPSVGVFATVPWKLRTAYYPKCHVLQGKEHCPIAPCFSAPMSNNPHAFPLAGPCAKSGQCDALHAIHPDRVAAKIEALLA
jgi:ADP-heptose:LPS heptosyltransferase